MEDEKNDKNEERKEEIRGGQQLAKVAATLSTEQIDRVLAFAFGLLAQ